MSDRIAIFNLGRIVQVGTPYEIYEQPADEFVADFVGTSNILNRDGKRYVLRPEKIRVGAAGDTFSEAGLHAETGRLLEAIYVGQFMRYKVALADGTEVIAVAQNFERSGHIHSVAGASVEVAWAKDSLFAL